MSSIYLYFCVLSILIDGERIFQEHGCSLQTVDLVADCPNLQIVTGGSRSPSSSKSSTLPSSTFTTSVTSMGQRPSALLRPKISLTWVLRGQQQSESNGTYPIANSNGSKIPLFYFFILTTFFKFEFFKFILSLAKKKHILQLQIITY